ncbi:Sip1-related alpha-galactosidase [Cohnella sp. REN36]|uniref:Sip1-related alpha-galactosidase n=1 Tax=Cohnella sp. REN36 TaxID=2887347 RepID=UPI001D152D3B|nr:Sip1-related alpha-galactosidase [Cohnella sp. REN36]MCC3376424.1 alpha-galactosidase [Cohnella sp. REN36]
MFGWMTLIAPADKAWRGRVACEAQVAGTAGAGGTTTLPLSPSAEAETSAGADRLGEYRETLLRFANSEGKVRVSLALRRYDAFAIGTVTGEIANDNAFGGQTVFAPDGALLLRLSASEAKGRWMAGYQHKDWWARPAFGSRWSEVPARTQSLLAQAADCGYAHLLPVCSPTVRADVQGEEGGVGIRLSTGRAGLTRLESAAFVFGEGADPYALVERHAEAAMAALGHPGRTRAAKTYPALFDKLGWCSWDAFYHQVNEEGVLAKAEELRELDVPVGWFMIDDGWSTVKDGRLAAWEADPVKFPGGLGRTVRTLKERYGIGRVGVWHTIAGYWNGVDPDSTIARAYAPFLRTNARGLLLPAPEPGAGFGFWHGWHGWLKRQGVDFVKVDSQSAVAHLWSGAHGACEAAAASHDALEASVALHFDDAIINCMGMSADSVWNRPRSAVSRSSDDFVPQERRGFAEHALQNAYNSYLHGAFYWGDWDMFWTRNHDDVQNAVLRAVSGGPVYISDPPGRTDAAKLRPLVYADGTILRCDRTSNPTTDCLLRDPIREPVPLKLWNTAGGAGVVAAFHLTEGAADVEGTVGPGDVPGLAGERFAVYEHFSRSASVVGAEAAVPFRLGPEGCALYTIVPLQGAYGFAPIGLTDKYVSAHAIADCRMEERRATVRLKEGGTFAFVADRAPSAVRIDGVDIEAAPLGGGLYEVVLPNGSRDVDIRFG